MFSERTAGSRDPNPLTRAVAAVRARHDVLDLSESNPTRVQLPLDTAEIAAAIAAGATTDYEPAPLGLEIARVAVSDYYSRRGVEVDPDRVVITATTSEAYAYLFRLLADPGDEIVAAIPSYPLFDMLAETAGVTLARHTLEYGPRWAMDPEALARALGSRTRAILSVSPNNPTGSCPTAVERRRLVQAARARGLAVISDEVFLDYLDEPERFAQHSFAREAEVLTFTLSGLSKVAAAPQLKLSWIVVNGPQELVTEALGRLEFIADAFLSVASPVQHALPRLLDMADETQDFLRDRLWDNAATLAAAAAAQDLTVRAKDGGWYAILDLPAGADDEAFAIQLVEEELILTQPGYLYDLPDPALVLSLLPSPDDFQAGIQKVVRRAAGL